MNLQLIGDGVEIDSKLKEICDNRISKPIEKYLSDFEEDLRVARVKIEKLAHHGFKVNFDMRLPGSSGHIYSEEEGDELLNVLVALRKEVEKQLRDYKDKLQEYR